MTMDMRKDNKSRDVEIIYGLIASLPSINQEILELNLIMDMSVQEISQIVLLPKRAIKKYLKKDKENLRDAVMKKSTDREWTSIVKEALETGMKENLKSIPDNESLYDTEYEHKIKMDWETYPTRESVKRHMYILGRKVSKAAVFITILLAAGSITGFAMFQGVFKINKRGDNDEIIVSSTENLSEQNITKPLIPRYIPEGYVEKDSLCVDDYAETIYSNNNKEIIIYQEINNKIVIDSENANQKQVLVNGKEAVYSYSKETTMLAWVDSGYLFEIVTNDFEIPFDILIRIAESIN